MNFNFAKETIEHVLPQHPGPDVLAAPAAEIAAGQTPEDLNAELVHSLENLALSTYNGKLGNHDFSREREIPGDSGLAMNRWLLAPGSGQLRDRMLTEYRLCGVNCGTRGGPTRTDAIED
ncbi:HNH endonuclease family protein [Nocardia sp. alder85J]|uniref:HNH endonuclease family protein n=1 Tax=Nocardia sp. alder85J TaxID=2862949 RepID=UPI001CD38AD3|nr:HNH endonuclease family protein [Nocardia sp. alder85J]MCX4092095.1 HNH endonuclease family protein [Nocardia sp. alder85J]